MQEWVLTVGLVTGYMVGIGCRVGIGCKVDIGCKVGYRV